MFKLYPKYGSYYLAKNHVANVIFGKLGLGRDRSSYLRLCLYYTFLTQRIIEIYCSYYAFHSLIRRFFISRETSNNRLFTCFLSPGKSHPIVQDLHITTARKFPQVAALKLPTNVVDINASEMGRFSPLRERDISGPVINSYYQKQEDMSKIDITTQSDPHVNKYDCRGAVNLSSSMQSNVPSPFTGNHSHLGMPGSQWGQGQKYLSDHLHSAHYLTLRNEYRGRMSEQGIGHTIITYIYLPV